MENKTIIIAKNLQYKTSDLLQYYNKKQVFIFKYKTVYQLMYSRNIGFYTVEYKHLKRGRNEQNYAARGRHYFFNASEANNLIKQDFFV